MPEDLHEYTVRSWCDDQDFEDAVRFIQTNGKGEPMGTNGFHLPNAHRSRGEAWDAFTKKAYAKRSITQRPSHGRVSIGAPLTEPSDSTDPAYFGKGLWTRELFWIC